MSVLSKSRNITGLSIILSTCLLCFAVMFFAPAQAQDSIPPEPEIKESTETKEVSPEQNKKSRKKDKKSKEKIEVTNKENTEPAPAKAEQTETSEPKPEAASSESPQSPRPYSEECVRQYNAGVELHQQGFLNQAIQRYRAAVAADDRIEPAYCNLGLIYCAQRNWSKAMDTLKKAIALKSNNPFTLNGMGSVLYSKGKAKEAIEHWQKALEADPNFASAYFNMGNAFENEKDMDKALENYVLSIKVNANMADAYYKIGCLFAKQKHNAQANTMLTKALQLSPEADFVADARKQITNLVGQFSKEESNDSEVKMNIVAPQTKEADDTTNVGK